MYKKLKILALITARGGSKGIPKKNIKQLGLYPLIAWTINAAKKSKYIDRLIVSTDDKKIAHIAEEYGCEVPFLRPENLALDTSSSMDVIFHALSNLDEDFDYLLLLQPTSPFRTTKDIDSIIEQTINNQSPMMVSVTQQKKHPCYSFEIDETNKLKPLIPVKKQLRRQDFPATYEHNGALYFTEIEFLKKEESFITSETTPFVMNGLASTVDIDTNGDWLFAEFLIEHSLINIEDFNCD